MARPRITYPATVRQVYKRAIKFIKRAVFIPPSALQADQTAGQPSAGGRRREKDTAAIHGAPFLLHGFVVMPYSWTEPIRGTCWYFGIVLKLQGLPLNLVLASIARYICHICCAWLVTASVRAGSW